MAKVTGGNSYRALIGHIFEARFKPGQKEVEFDRDDLEPTAQALGIALPKNLGDVIYAIRYRIDMPDVVKNTQPKGEEWIIEGAGRARYKFKLVQYARVLPRTDMVTISIPDATPEVIRQYALDDEQALLAIVRYNRLIDIFLGLTTFSLQNHLRTTVKQVGQIEIDELYLGIDTHGCHYAIPVQAKGGSDQISTVQTTQDIRWCAERFEGMRCRALSVQFISEEDENRVAMFELTIKNDVIKVVQERHYRLVQASNVDQKMVRAYMPENL